MFNGKFRVASSLTHLLSMGCNVIIEATTENLNVKQEVFCTLTSILKEQGVPASDVLLCSTTIGLTISSIIAYAKEEYKPRCFGFRLVFDQRSYVMPLVLWVTYQFDEQNVAAALSLLDVPTHIHVEEHTRTHVAMTNQSSPLIELTAPSHAL